MTFNDPYRYGAFDPMFGPALGATGSTGGTAGSTDPYAGTNPYMGSANPYDASVPFGSGGSPSGTSFGNPWDPSYYYQQYPLALRKFGFDPTSGSAASQLAGSLQQDALGNYYRSMVTGNNENPDEFSYYLARGGRPYEKYSTTDYLRQLIDANQRVQAATQGGGTVPTDTASQVSTYLAQNPRALLSSILTGSSATPWGNSWQNFVTNLFNQRYAANPTAGALDIAGNMFGV